MNQTRRTSGRGFFGLPWLALTPVLLALLTACEPPPAMGEADIGVSVQALAASDVAKITLTVSASDISPSIVSDLPKTGTQWKGIIGNIPAGTNRTFTAQAFNAANTKIYEGQATGVTITAGDTATVVIMLQQSTAPTPYVNSAPRITALTASAAQVKPGQTVTLAVTATDADGDALSYTWTATGGSFTNGSTATPTWTAPAADGTYTLSVSVSDGKDGLAGLSLKLAVVGGKGNASVSVSFNSWPVVSQVTGTPFGQIAPGGVVNLNATAADPEGDTLTYGWTDDCTGSFNGLTVKNPVWTAPATAPTGGVCKLTVAVSDGKGGSTTGRLSVNVGLPTVPNVPPVIDVIFQSSANVAAGDVVTLSADAHDPEGTALSFAWSTTGGTLGTPVTSASSSKVSWTAPASPNIFAITLTVQDAGGQKTTQTFTASFATQSCVKTVTSYLTKANPYLGPVTVNYSMVGGGGGLLETATGNSGSKVSASFTLGAGNLEVFVGGGGGSGYSYASAGAGGAGYFGGGSGGIFDLYDEYGGYVRTYGGGGGGGSSAILSGGQIVEVAAGGFGHSLGAGTSGGGGGRTGGGGELQRRVQPASQAPLAPEGEMPGAVGAMASPAVMVPTPQVAGAVMEAVEGA